MIVQVQVPGTVKGLSEVKRRRDDTKGKSSHIFRFSLFDCNSLDATDVL